MMQKRPADQRGHTNIDWLNSRHTFSFGHYQDPQQMGYRGLRVINDDRVAPGAGFGEHPHRDMEILSWVLDGALNHSDSMGHIQSLKPGTAQLMSAGTGVRHAEFNGSKTDPVHFLQIWIEPDRGGYDPNYQELETDSASRQGRFLPLASPDGRDGSLTLRQNTVVAVADLDAETAPEAAYALDVERHAWVHVATGSATVNGITLDAGDGLAISQETDIRATTDSQAQLLMFDLP